MRLATLLHRLAVEGFTVTVEPGRGLGIVPANRLTPEIRAEVLKFKGAILEMLGDHGEKLLPMFRDVLPWPTDQPGLDSRETMGGGVRGAESSRRHKAASTQRPEELS